MPQTRSIVSAHAEPLAGIALPARAEVSPDVLQQTIEGHTVLLDLIGERYYSLDDVGTRIWQLLTDEPDVATVVEQMLTIYDVNRASLTRDVAAFLDALAKAQLVRQSGTYANE